MEEQWIINLECKLEKTLAAQIESWKMGYILRVPRYLREVYENDLNPKIVSFGPYHHNQDHLKLFEPFKHRALRNYLIRAGRTLAEVAEAMRKTVKEVMELYIGLDETWTEDRFIELMLLDGCFLLDLLIWHSFQFQPLSLVMILQTDALRLESQLPISVLAELLEVGGHMVHDNIKFVDCCYPDMSSALQNPPMVSDIREIGRHYLGIFVENMTLEGDYFYDRTYSVHPASELIDSGIQFVESKSKSLKDISFENGVLKLPKIDVNNHTEAILLNMIAYEQLVNEEEAVISYVFLMDNLINFAADVALLREKGIISSIGSDQDIADIFNRLPKSIVKELYYCKYYERSLTNVNLMLNDYYNRRILNRWRASFMQTYFKNPWVFASLLGALILLILAVLQTVYTIIPYYKGS